MSHNYICHIYKPHNRRILRRAFVCHPIAFPVVSYILSDSFVVVDVSVLALGSASAVKFNDGSVRARSVHISYYSRLRRDYLTFRLRDILTIHV